VNVLNKQLPIKNQQGFTIVELLIAGTLGILLLAGVIQLFVGSNKNYTLQGQLADIQEDGRFALMFLKEELQQGGWADNPWLARPAAINMANSTDGVTDSVAVAYSVQAGGVNSFDCNGAAVLTGQIENRFFVGGANGDELLCQGNGVGAVAQPLINGVTNFQVLYGVETDAACPDGVVNSYITHDQFVAAGGSVLLVSVRIALLLSSKENVLPADESHDHQLLDTSFNTNDKLTHRLFQQTIYMPNGIFLTISDPSAVMDCMTDVI